MHLVAWLLTGVLTAVPVVYAVLHWGDKSFRDSALAGWFGTVVGIVVGVPVALWLTQFQQRAQQAAEGVRLIAQRHEELTRLRMRMLEEIRYNLDVLKRLQDVLSKSIKARTDVWDWANKVSESFEFSARREFEREAVTPSERLADAPVELGYRDLRRLSNWVKHAIAAHAFFYGFAADENSANWQLQEVRNYTGIVEAELKNAEKYLANQGAP